MAEASQINLLGYTQQALADLMASWGHKPFHGRQLFKWIHYHGVCDFNVMTNLSKALRADLASRAVIGAPEIVLDKPAQDGTRKWLIRLSDGNIVETVFIPEPGRGTLCVSSQVGCMLTCTFCSTGKQGFSRNLSSAEIIGQVWAAVRALSEDEGRHDRHLTNVVMMGMGEPLMNIDAVVPAMDIMMDDDGYGLSKRRVTLSTSGVVPKLYELMSRIQVSLAVSLHAPDDTLRDEIVPINRKYPLKELMQACRDYVHHDPHRSITFEYVMLAGVNDQMSHADELVKLIADVPSKVNLIPFNPFPGTDYTCSSNNQIHRFQRRVSAAGITTTIRKTRGDDISAACGQLVGMVKDRTNRQARFTRSVQRMQYKEKKHVS